MIVTLAVQGGTSGGEVGFVAFAPGCMKPVGICHGQRGVIVNNATPTGPVPCVSPYPANALFGQPTPALSDCVLEMRQTAKASEGKSFDPILKWFRERAEGDALARLKNQDRRVRVIIENPISFMPSISH